MSYTIKPKRSGIAGVSPTAANLQVGEIAMNTTDGSLFSKDVNNAVKRFGVVEGSVALNAVGRYDGDKFVGSLLTVDENGIVSGDGSGLTNVTALTTNGYRIVVLTAAAYSGTVPDPSTLYFII